MTDKHEPGKAAAPEGERLLEKIRKSPRARLVERKPGEATVLFVKGEEQLAIVKKQLGRE